MIPAEKFVVSKDRNFKRTLTTQVWTPNFNEYLSFFDTFENTSYSLRKKKRKINSSSESENDEVKVLSEHKKVKVWNVLLNRTEISNLMLSVYLAGPCTTRM